MSDYYMVGDFTYTDKKSSYNHDDALEEERKQCPVYSLKSHAGFYKKNALQSLTLYKQAWKSSISDFSCIYVEFPSWLFAYTRLISGATLFVKGEGELQRNVGGWDWI